MVIIFLLYERLALVSPYWVRARGNREEDR